MSDRCEFCGRDPFERVDVGFGSSGVPVAVTCCELGVSVYDHRNDDDAEVTVSVSDLRKIAGAISSLRWQVERRDRTLGKLWRRRGSRGATMSDTVKWTFTQPTKPKTFRVPRGTILVRDDGSMVVVSEDTFVTIPVPDDDKPIKTEVEWK